MVLSTQQGETMPPTYAERDAHLAYLGFKSYTDYLHSDLWHSIRDRVLEERGTGCTLCKRRYLVIHHIDYTLEVLTGEDIRALIPLCRKCHRCIEFKKKRKRTLAEAQVICKKMMEWREKHVHSKQRR